MLDGGTVVGGYSIERVLGRGGMGVVYRARHVATGRDVALKVLADELRRDPEFVARFEREGRLQASLDHPHVVTVYEAGSSEHGLYLAMRLVEGATLAELMRRRDLDARRALAMLGQVAAALDAAHDAGLIHRDVKPQNVLVAEGGDAYLGDFGLTRLGGATAITATGRLLGTVAYIAPEVIRGAPATAAADRYAFAAMAFECLTGTVVFPRETEAAILFAHTSEPPPRASRRRAELPRTLDEVFARALAKEPGKRPQRAAALVETIGTALDKAGATELGPPPVAGAGALDATTVEPQRAGLATRRGRPSGRTALAALAAATLGALLATVLWLALDDDGAARPASGVPPPLAGTTVLGGDLAAPGRTLDCRGRAPTSASPGCTVISTRLPGRVLVVPEDGVIRRWAVRDARGEVRLSVVRPRGTGGFQVARSRNEFVDAAGVHVFATDLAVERGDLVGVVALPGSGYGARGVDGATTRRWVPNLAEGKPRDSRGQELLLRAELLPGVRPRVPESISGARAAGAEVGRVHARRRLRFTNGRRVEVALVALGDRLVLDEFLDGRRAARIEVPDFDPTAGRILTFDVYAEEGDPQQLGITVEYVRDESARILRHFYSAFPNELVLID